jgi:hypothetical protein
MTDIDDAETLVRNHQGIENDDIGRLLVRLVREVRGLRVAVKDLRDRVTALENPPPVVVPESPPVTPESPPPVAPS